jgi:aspartyl-tRNA(Asn)/glutamyl-tRNA(Gln) amidotransferase subunit C
MVTHEEILKIANLAKLSVTPEELDSLTEDMNKIIGFADTINAASSDKSTDFDNINGLSNVLREDSAELSYSRDDILKNAEDSEDGYFVVRRRR